MVEAALRKAEQVGIAESEFWDLTPYRFSLKHDERMRAQTESDLRTGWFAERFARETRLQGPLHYIAEFLEPGEPLAAAAEDVAIRIAATWGLEIEALTE